jgi:signal transduction histidine kinase
MMARVAEAKHPELDRRIAELVATNQREAIAAVERGVRLEAQARKIVVGTQLVGLFGLLLVGAWGFHRVARERDQHARLRLLEERNRDLDAFAGRVAHDLRNPITAITLATDIVGEQVHDPRALDRLRRGTKRVQQLVDDLLALSRASGELALATCNPATVAARLRDDFAEQFGGDAVLHLDIADALVPYAEGLLGEAMWNLVENAVKYRREDVTPEIRISGRPTTNRYELSIADNGAGMSIEDAAHVFEPFYRGSRARDVGGTGLGLSIVKRIVEARGGAVSVSSRFGEGSTFVLSLPLATQARAASRG